jgi:tripeptidyl-peptidase-1
MALVDFSYVIRQCVIMLAGSFLFLFLLFSYFLLPFHRSYFPQFPASSPYVVAVGGTQGPESGETEVTCSSITGGVITSGGGFSDYYKRPSYQNTVVQNYLNSYTSKNSPYPGYNTTGRGYPDVSLLAYNYYVFVGGQRVPVSGTSASAPVFAAMVSLVNANRKATGQSLLGWLNPALYSGSASFVHDITSGQNNCGAYEGRNTVCCGVGFTAQKGW